MTTQQVAEAYHALASQKKWQEIIDKFYHDDIICIEPPNSKSPPLTKGKEAVRKKAAHFESMIEQYHGGYSTPPIVAGNMFTVGMGMDITLKGAGRSRFDEFGIFTVVNGKIVREEFIMQWTEGGHEYENDAP